MEALQGEVLYMNVDIENWPLINLEAESPF